MSYSPDASVDPEAAATRAHVLLESEIEARLSAIRDLAKQRNALHAALAAYEEGWSKALKAGWTSEQLRQIGLKEAEQEKPGETPVAVDKPKETSYAAPVSIHGDFRAEPASVPAPAAPLAAPVAAPSFGTFGGPVAVPASN